MDDNLTRSEAVILLDCIVPWAHMQRTVTFGHLYDGFATMMIDEEVSVTPRALSNKLDQLTHVLMIMGHEHQVAVPPITAIVINSKTRIANIGIGKFVERYLRERHPPAADISGPVSGWTWALRYCERAVWDFPAWPCLRTMLVDMTREEFDAKLKEKL